MKQIFSLCSSSGIVFKRWIKTALKRGHDLQLALDVFCSAGGLFSSQCWGWNVGLAMLGKCLLQTTPFFLSSPTRRGRDTGTSRGGRWRFLLGGFWWSSDPALKRLGREDWWARGQPGLLSMSQKNESKSIKRASHQSLFVESMNE